MTVEQKVEQFSPRKREQIKTGIANIISGLLGGIDEESKKSPLYDELVKHGEIFKNPDTFFFSLTYDQRNATKAALKTVKELNTEKSEEYCHVFLNFKFYTAHIERLCIDFSGSFGSADKSGAIVGRYLNYLRTGDKGPWDVQEDRCYWLPTFGSQDDWFEYMNSLHYLYYGQTNRYLSIYQKLIKLGTEERNKLMAEHEAKKAQAIQSSGEE